VGRCFIAVQSSPNLQASLDFFRNTFGNTASPIRKLPSIDLSVVTLKDGSKIEIDQHHGEGRKRERVAGGLPAGLAVVSFECSSFDKTTDKFLSPPAKSALEPFAGRHAGTMQGPAGELIELLDT
jgi:hypothetical protein